MTALLAFFIVLNSLAEEQTGADIHAGTGSFIQATDRLGVPGIFSDGMSRYRLQLQQSAPLYVVPDDSGEESFGNAAGPDEDGDNTWVRDREQQEFERFLNELERLHAIRRARDVAGEVSFDRMSPLPREAPHFDREMRELLVALIPMLKRRDYEIEIVVWATTPSRTAWTRSVQQADQIRNEAIAVLHLRPEEAQRLTAIGKPWIHPDVKRPAVSVIARRLERVSGR